MAMPLWIKAKPFQRDLFTDELNKHGGLEAGKLLFTEHYLSHAASALFCPPFEDALVLTMDGVGEWATTSVGAGQSNWLDILLGGHPKPAIEGHFKTGHR
jgi:carbamoyltransferase